LTVTDRILNELKVYLCQMVSPLITTYITFVLITGTCKCYKAYCTYWQFHWILV